MEQGTADAREGGNKRSSMGLAGMFPFLQPRASFETDQCDRVRKAAGGKVKPGQPMLRTDSEDLATIDSPSANSSASNSPSRGWMMTAGGREGALHQSWPGPNQTGSVSKGLFSKLMSKKNKKQDAALPASPTLESSPYNMQLGIGSGLKASRSIEALHQAGELSCVDDSCPSTPTTSKALGDPRDGSDEGAFVSCYATPVGSEAMDSPANNLYPEGYSANATLDLCQQMAFESGEEGVPVMDMARELPDVFTPGFNQLLQGGRRLQAVQLDSPGGSQYGELEPTIALVSAAQLAQAGCLQDQPSSVLLGPSQGENCDHNVPTDSAAAAAPPTCNAQDLATDPGCAKQQQEIVAAAVAAAQAANEQQEHQQQLDQGSSQAVSSEDIKLEMVSAAADIAAAADEHTAAAAAAAVVQTAGSAQTVQQTPRSPKTASTGEMTDIAAMEVATTTIAAAVAGHMGQHAVLETAFSDSPAQQSVPQQQVSSISTAPWELVRTACSSDQDHGRPEAGTADGQLPARADPSSSTAGSAVPVADPAVAAAALLLSHEDKPGVLSADALLDVVEAQPAQQAVNPAGAADVKPAADAELEIAGGSGVRTASGAETASAQPQQLDFAFEETGAPAVAHNQHIITPPAIDASTSINSCHSPTDAAADQPAEEVAVQQSIAAGVAVPAEAALQPEVTQTVITSPAATAKQSQPAAADEPSSSDPQTAQQIMAVAPVGTNGASCGGSSNVAALEGLLVPPGTQEEDTDGPLEEDASLPLPTAEESITSVASEGQSDSPQPHSDTCSSSQAAAPKDHATAATRSHIQQRKLSPMAVVRESMPLFVSDPTRAMGSPLRLDIEDDSLDAQDMQLLAQANTSTSSRSTGTAIAGVAEGVSSAGPHSRLLCHGAAQRVAVGKGAAGGFLGGLAPVEEASFTSCSPEESPTGAYDNASSSGTLSPQYEGVEVGMAVMSPLRTRQREGSMPQMTPAAAERALDLGLSPGSAYSTPVLAVQGGHERGSIQGATPQSAVSSAIGSAIRGMPSSSSAAGNGMELSPAMPGMAGPSPTLTLLPTLSGQGLSATSGGAQEGDGSTPSLLDIRAASPSAVYGMRFTATPFRGALAALPLDAALHAPLVDSSPFNLTDDGGMDTVCLADEAQRLAQNLAAAAGGFGPASPAAQTPAAGIKQAAVATPSSAGDRSAGAGSPTDELRDLHVVMLTKQLAEVQKRAKELEVENLRLREQVEIYEFEKTELNSQEEMEKQARQYAEEQLQQLQVEIQQLLQAKSAQASQMLSMRQEFEGFQQEAQRQHEAMLQQHAALQGTIAQAQQERDDVLDRLNLLDMQLTAMTSHNSDLSAALEAQRQRGAELEAALAARDRDVAEAARLQGEAQAKVEKAMEQVIAANTAKEHVKQKATDEIAKVQQMLLERQQLMAEREKRVQDYQHLKQKYAQKSAALKEAEKRCQDRDAENQELMAMCDQLLQQQEAGRAAKAGGSQ